MESPVSDRLESSDNDASEGSIIEELERETVQSDKRKHQEEDLTQRKRKKIDKWRPPTVQELNQLRETENLFNSSLFRMQIEEMLKELRIKSKYQNLFNEWFSEFKSLVFGMETSDEYDLTDTSWLRNFSVKPPVSFTPACDKGSFQFLCPTDVTIGGSYSIQAYMGPFFSIDLHVHIPEEFFDKNDLINLRFDRKRALYLTLLAEELMGSSLVEEVHFVQANGCFLKPLLELKPTGKLGKHVQVLLWPVTNCSAIMLKRLRPGRGNIYPEWFLGSKAVANMVTLSPHYNSGVAQDLVWRQNQQLLEAELSTASLREGLILLKVWLRQRFLDKGYGCFGGFIMAMYLVYLLQNKRLNKMMSSYQVARVTWNCLAQSDWTMDGISLSSASNGPSVRDFHEHFEVVFVDVSGFCNLCAHVRKEIYLQVRRASAQAVALLDMSGSLCFQALFMTPVEFQQCYDHLIRFNKPYELVKSVKKLSAPEQKLAWAGWILPQALHFILAFVEKALGERVVSIGVQPSKIERWPCLQNPPSPADLHGPVLVGLRLNGAEAFEKLQKGPEADQPEAEEFRSFWGELSQLRRFRDGQITEAILWADSPSPCEQAVAFVLKKYLGMDQNSYLHISNLPESILMPPLRKKMLLKGIDNQDAAVAAQAVILSFDTLSKQLRTLTDMTLSVNSVQGISPLFRYTDVFSPLPLTDRRIKKNLEDDSPSVKLEKIVPLFCASVEAVMTLELSGKWPQNLEAVRRLKAAFCLQLAKAVQKECSLTAQAHIDHVDIYKNGYVFRIWLAALKEVALMKQVNEHGLVSFQDTPITRALEEKLVVLPKLSSSLHGLHKQFSGFGPTACLAKRWVSSQLIGPPHIPDLVTELLVAYLFVSPEPFCPPVESQLGLLHFLRLVSSTDWRTMPIIVNLNAEFSREQIAEMETKFHSSRNSFPPLFLATPYDRSISHCTRTAPSLQMLIRLSALASGAQKMLETQLLTSQRPDIMAMFRPNLQEYDVVITLNRKKLSRIYESIDETKESNYFDVEKYAQCQREKIPVVEFDPVQFYLAELRDGYGDCALFFHDQYGGSIIGVVWIPSVTREQDFKVSVVKGHKPTSGTKVTLNLDAILEDFQTIGKDFVNSVTVQHKMNQPTDSSSSTT